MSLSWESVIRLCERKVSKVTGGGGGGGGEGPIYFHSNTFTIITSEIYCGYQD